MIFSRHRFTRTFAEPLAAPAAHEAAVIEEELQQAQPGSATVQMAPQHQAVAQPGVEVFNERAAAWRVLSRCWDVAGNAATIAGMKRTTLQHSASANDAISYAGYRFPPDVISYAVWLYYRFPLSLRMVEELLAARGIDLTYETVRRWSVKFGLGIARRIRATALAQGDKWHLDEVVVNINGKKHWLWRAVHQYGAVLDVLVQSRRDRHAARRLMRKLLKKHGRAPRVLITDKLKSYAAANRDLGLNVEHRQHKGLNNRAENSHQPTRVREKVMRRFKSARHLQRFTSVLDQVENLFMHCRYNANAQDKRQARTQAFEAWEAVSGNSLLDRLAA